jgi:membrane-associated protein
VEALQELLKQIYDVKGIIQWGGLAMICAIVFAETGLMIGFFLPGDSLLVTAGVFAAAGLIDIYLLLGLVSLCAVVGDQLGYYIGKKTGQALFTREDSLLFKRSHVLRAQQFYERYGAKTIVIARFVPIVRTFAPVVAGVGNMNYRRFVTYNIVGGILWVFSMSLTGYLLGSVVPEIEKHLHYVIALVIFLSILPAFIEAWRERRRKQR